MNVNLKQLYQSVILTHNKAPYNFRKNEGVKYQIEAYNSLCGDRFTFYFDIKDNIITNISFHGFGCAISKSSASVLVKKFENQSLEEAKKLCKEYFSMIKEGILPADEELQAFAAAKDFPGREQCAILNWEAIEQFLQSTDL